MKNDCDHDNIRFTVAGTDLNNRVRVRLSCYDCETEWEYIINESDFIAAICELDNDPNIYVDGVLQNE